MTQQFLYESQKKTKQRIEILARLQSSHKSELHPFANCNGR